MVRGNVALRRSDVRGAESQIGQQKGTKGTKERAINNFSASEFKVLFALRCYADRSAYVRNDRFPAGSGSTAGLPDSRTTRDAS